MKKVAILISIISALFVGTGCSSTWDGVKNDTNKAWKSTKETVHDATK